MADIDLERLYEIMVAALPIDDHTPERTPGQGDFGKWDATDDPDSDETLHPFALNQQPYKPSEVD